MHARFADSMPASPESVDKIETETLDARIEQFKQNPNNMAVLHEFIEEVVQQAEMEASKQQKATDKSQQGKGKRQSFAIPDFKNGKVVNRARGFVVRIFDAICNCANNNAAAATTRFKLRSSSAGGAAAGRSEPETLALNKKNKKGKGVSMADDVEAVTAGTRLMEQ